jgi:hypothetical protein
MIAILVVVFVSVCFACPFAAMLGNGASAQQKLDIAALHHDAKLAQPLLDNEHKRALKASDVVKTFVLSSRVKTPTGNVFGQGFPVGYAVDGIESPEIVVTAGRTYKFTVLSACNHPFYLTTDSRGKGRAPLETGFDVPPAKRPRCQVLWRASRLQRQLDSAVRVARRRAEHEDGAPVHEHRRRRL